MSVKKDLTGKRFGRWIVIALSHRVPGSRTGHRYYWLCRCECGTERTVRSDLLVRGESESCGCSHRTHGRKYTREYRIWIGIKDRCFNPKSRFFHRYGGRGITMCDDWRSSFEAFYSYVGDSPSPRHSIDRIDNDRGYEPGNVRWATQREQNRNCSNNRLICFDGNMLPLAVVAERIGISADTISHRLRSGWSVDEAVATPLCHARSS